MKEFFSVLLIVGFIVAAAFGALTMGHGQTHDRVVCFASIMKASGCPDEVNSAFSFGFHLDAFNSLFTAVLGHGWSNVFLVLLTLVLTLGLILVRSQDLSRFSFVFEQKQKRFAESYVYPFNRPMLRWQALHENSPSVF